MGTSLHSRGIAIGLLAVTLAATAGCSVPNTISLYSRTGGTGPSLAGRSVAVLPALAVGGEAQTAVAMTRAARAMFASDIAGVRFNGVDVTRTQLRQAPAVLETVRAAVIRPTASDFRIKGKPRTLLDAKRVGGIERKRRQIVTLTDAPNPSAIGPDRIDPTQLQPFASDYVLFPVPLGAYVQNTTISALYGAIPFMWTQSVIGLTPRAVFLLYDAQTGEKTWETQVGTVFASHPSSVNNRGLPMLGAAYLLTGDVDTALGRWLDQMPQEQ